MNNEWIDVSVPLRNGMVHWPGDEPFHREQTMFLNKGDAANLSRLSSTAHVGTHMDAPRHFVPDGAGMDTLPLSAVIGRARVIEIQDPEVIPVDEIARRHPQRGERLLFKTKNSASVWDTDEFQKHFVHIPSETAHYLAESGVQLVGVDYLSVGGYETDGAETHRALLGAGIWIIEGLDLRGIEPGDYDLICLPLKLVGSDGAPARAVLRKI